MTMSVFPNLYFSIAVLSIIAFIDVFVKFKNGFVLKSFFLLLPFSIAMVALINSFNVIQFVFFIAFFKSCLAISLLNIFSSLYFPKFRNWTLSFSLLMLLVVLFLALVNNNVFPQTQFINQFKYISIDQNLNIKIPPIIRLIRLSFLFIVASHLIYFWYVISKKLNLNNLYYAKIRTWTNFIFALTVIVIVSNIGIAFTKDRDFWVNSLTVSMCFYLLLLILKRPTFLNTSAKKIAFGHKFNIEEESEINELIFQTLFLEQKYFTKKDASLEGLASIMEVHPTRIADYIVKTYDMTFGELVNKNRVNYFFEIVQKPEFQNFTIDALAREVGFSSRQHLYKPFKKFHGGNPSDLLAINTADS